MIKGYLPSSGGLAALAAAADTPAHYSTAKSPGVELWDASELRRNFAPTSPIPTETFDIPALYPPHHPALLFYRVWDPHGVLSNFSGHDVWLPDSDNCTPLDQSTITDVININTTVDRTAADPPQPATRDAALHSVGASLDEILAEFTGIDDCEYGAASGDSANNAAPRAAAGSFRNENGDAARPPPSHQRPAPATLDYNGQLFRRFESVEHYYQSRKLSRASVEGAALCEAVAGAASPEEAARIGRLAEHARPDLIREDWSSVKLDAMRLALLAKYSGHPEAREMLFAGGGGYNEAGAMPILVEDSPNDYFWGRGMSR